MSKPRPKLMWTSRRKYMVCHKPDYLYNKPVVVQPHEGYTQDSDWKFHKVLFVGETCTILEV